MRVRVSTPAPPRLIYNLFMSLILPTPNLLCPSCERPLSSHRDGECPKRRVSRRWFLGALGTAATAAALKNVVVQEQAGALVSLAAPKIHGAIHLHASPLAWVDVGALLRESIIDRLKESAQLVADSEGRPVLATTSLPDTGIYALTVMPSGVIPDDRPAMEPSLNFEKRVSALAGGRW